MAKKVGKHHEKNAKAVVSFLILALALGVYRLFSMNQESLLTGGNFQMFVVLIVGLFALFAVLLFLLNKPSKN